MIRSACIQRFHRRFVQVLPMVCSHTRSATTVADASSSSRGEPKPVRVFSLELNKIKGDYRRNPTLAQQAECLKLLNSTPLNAVVGLDGKAVAHYLGVATNIRAPADAACVEIAVGWLVQNVESLNFNTACQCLSALRELEYDDIAHVLSLLTSRLRQHAASGSASSMVQLYDAVLFADKQQAFLSSFAEDILSALLARRHELSTSEKLHVVRCIVSTSPALRSPTTSSAAVTVIEDVLKSDALGSLSLEDHVSLASSAVSLRCSDNTTPLFSAAFKYIEQAKSELAGKPALVCELLDRYARSSTSSSSSSLYSMLEEFLTHSLKPEELTVEDFCKFAASAIKADASRFFSNIPSMKSHLHSLLARPMSSSSWSPEAIRFILPVLETLGDGYIGHINSMISFRLDELSAAVPPPSHSNSISTVSARDVTAVMTKTSLDSFGERIGALVKDSVSTWRVASALHYLTILSTIQTRASRTLLRDAAPRLCLSVSHCTPSQLSNLAACFGRARVRHDALCEAITKRAVELSKEISLHEVTVILSTFAAIEFRDVSLFLDFAPLILEKINEASSSHISNLMVSYAKPVIWNYKVFAALAGRAFELREQFDSLEMISMLTAMTRMDFMHDDLTNFFLKSLKHNLQTLSLYDCVQVAISFSQQSSMWDRDIFDQLATRFAAEPELMDATLVGEALLSFARVGLKDHEIFSKMSLRALAVAPTCPPAAVATLATAYATAGMRNEELFGIFSERLLVSKEQFPAVLIAAILDAFAVLDIRDDRLFIEMIPRVRHVGTYGGPKDIANVVRAYSTIGLWHYKLFVKLGTRAVQVRGECKPGDIVAILTSYSRVGMKLDKLFLEFSPRIQSLIHILAVADIAAIIKAYAASGVREPSLFSALGDRIVELGSVVDDQDLTVVHTSFMEGKIRHEQLEALVAKRLKAKEQSSSSSSVPLAAQAPSV